MCGIAGLFGPDLAPSALEAQLRRLTAALHHRGPDAAGHIVVGRPGVAGGLAATRLAILDPSPAGHQPMHDPQTGNWIALNGEIYNHLELRRELDDPAEPWRSGSDTETVLRAYRRWGGACVERLRGMFGVAVWDQADGSLWCARDRLGIKPFYFASEGGRFVFASEVRAILATDVIGARLDLEALSGYVRFGAVPEPLTLLAGIRSLPAGHTLRVKAGQPTPSRPYWTLPERGAPMHRATVGPEVARAVREHLLSDVPVACLLSGGIDSAVVVALAARSGQRVHAFTFGFDDRSLDEADDAAETARWVGAEHRVLRLGRDDVARLLPDAVRAMDLPTADGVNTWVIARAVAAEGYKVVLSGLGGDELFGGYPSFRLLPRLQRWRAVVGRVPARLRSLAAGGRGRGGRLVAMTDRDATLRERYEELRAHWAQDELAAMGLQPKAHLTDLDPARDLPASTAISLLELSGYMRSTLLRDSDAMSMAHSLELRVPLLDHQLVATCLAAGVAAERPAKRALLEAAGAAIPPTVAARRKRGFALPMDAWLRGPLSAYVDAGLDVIARRLPRLDAWTLRARFDQGTLPWARVWSLVVLGHWLERHVPS